MAIEEEILKELRGYTGTEHYYKIPFSNYIYTDGINALINKCDCHWLIDDYGILLHNKKDLQKPFILLEIKVNSDKTAIITLKEDSNLKPFYTQKLKYTTFPLKEYSFYICDNVFLLKSEY